MYQLLNLNSQHGRLALDLKLANIFSGIQPGSAKFPCIYARYLKLNSFLAFTLLKQKLNQASDPD